MEAFFGTLLLIILIIYLLRPIMARLFPRFLMWLMKRQMKKSMRYAYGDDPSGGSQQKSRRSRPQQQQPQRKGKIFTKDVGEYVDFEEVNVYQDDTTTRATSIKYQEESQISDADWEEIK